MPTPIEKSVTRRCPRIQSPEGRILDASLDPEDGGSLILKWSGLRKASASVFSLRELMEVAENGAHEAVEIPEAGEESGGAQAPDSRRGGADARPGDYWFLFDKLSAKLHTTPMDLKAREVLVKTLGDIRSHEEWLASGNESSWEQWQAERN